MNRREILLIDDNPDAREALAMLLEHHGYAVRCAESGSDALQQVTQLPPDLIITDLGMPVMSGFDLLQEFRKLPSLADVPVIVVSGNGDIHARVAGLDLGADDFLAKPVQVDELLARVRRHLLRSDRQRDITRESMVDALTGVLNRRGLANLFARAVERPSLVDGVGIAVMLVDLNEFKSINDTWGHAVGDSALCAVSRGLQDALRANDRVGRLGGDEFAIVLPEVCNDDCIQLLQRVRQISPVVFGIVEGASLHVGLSLGVASAGPGETFEAVIARADAAMYEDKRRQKLARDSLS
jgi:two-component system cell cycle response regulator